MNTEKLAQWLTITGNLGIIVGLIFVAVELNQNTVSNKGAAYQTWVAANLALNSSLIPADKSREIADGMVDSSNLTAGSQMPFAMWHFSYFQQIQATDYLYQIETLDRALWEAEIHRAAVHLELPGVRQWWDAGGKTQLTPEFVELIESTQSKSTRWSWDDEKGFVADER